MRFLTVSNDNVYFVNDRTVVTVSQQEMNSTADFYQLKLNQQPYALKVFGPDIQTTRKSTDLTTLKAWLFNNQNFFFRYCQQNWKAISIVFPHVFSISPIQVAQGALSSVSVLHLIQLTLAYAPRVFPQMKPFRPQLLASTTLLSLFQKRSPARPTLTNSSLWPVRQEFSCFLSTKTICGLSVGHPTPGVLLFGWTLTRYRSVSIGWTTPSIDSSLENSVRFRFYGAIFFFQLYYRLYARSLLTFVDPVVVIEPANGALQTLDGLAVDWVVGNLYWSTGGNREIWVSRLDGAWPRFLISLDGFGEVKTRDLNTDDESSSDFPQNGAEEPAKRRPAALAIDPINRYLFFNVWSGTRGRIERTWLDGTHR